MGAVGRAVGDGADDLFGRERGQKKRGEAGRLKSQMPGERERATKSAPSQPARSLTSPKGAKASGVRSTARRGVGPLIARGVLGGHRMRAPRKKKRVSRRGGRRCRRRTVLSTPPFPTTENPPRHPRPQQCRPPPVPPCPPAASVRGFREKKGGGVEAGRERVLAPPPPISLLLSGGASPARAAAAPRPPRRRQDGACGHAPPAPVAPSARPKPRLGAIPGVSQDKEGKKKNLTQSLSLASHPSLLSHRPRRPPAHARPRRPGPHRPDLCVS